MQLSPANVAHSKCQHWRGWRGQERERSCIRFYNSVERHLKMVSFIVTRKSYERNLYFVQRPWQSAVYIFKKNREQKKADLDAKKQFMVRFTLRFTPFKLYIYRKRWWTWNCFLSHHKITDPYKLINSVFFLTGKSNNAEFRTVYTL